MAGKQSFICYLQPLPSASVTASAPPQTVRLRFSQEHRSLGPERLGTAALENTLTQSVGAFAFRHRTWKHKRFSFRWCLMYPSVPLSQSLCVSITKRGRCDLNHRFELISSEFYGFGLRFRRRAPSSAFRTAGKDAAPLGVGAGARAMAVFAQLAPLPATP